MKIKILLGLIVASVIVTGCVNTVSGRKTGGVPFVTDDVKSRYERSAAQVYAAAKEVITDNGGIFKNEIIRLNVTNAPIYALEGRVQERKVFVSVQQQDPATSEITTQVRTTVGGTDQKLAYELDKQIALKLAR